MIRNLSAINWPATRARVRLYLLAKNARKAGIIPLRIEVGE